MTFNLETLEKRKPVVDLNQYQFTFYGSAGIGKTSVAGFFFEEPLFLAFEKGQNALEAYVVDIYTWKDMLQFVKQAKKMKKEGKEFPFKNIIVDTADIMRDKCEDYVCMMNGWDTPADGNMGAGWAAVRKELEDRISDLMSLGLMVHFIAHDKVQNIKRKDIEDYDKITLQLGSTAVNSVIKRPDFILYFDKEFSKDADGNVASKRVIRLDGGENYEAKSRITGLPPVIDCGNTAEETAKILKELFTKKLEEWQKNGKKDSKKDDKEEKPLEVKKYAVPKKKLEELSDLALEQVKKKKFTMDDIVKLVKEHTSVDKIMEIEKEEEYTSLLKAIRD